jgi:hypothetical protein
VYVKNIELFAYLRGNYTKMGKQKNLFNKLSYHLSLKKILPLLFWFHSNWFWLFLFFSAIFLSSLANACKIRLASSFGYFVLLLLLLASLFLSWVIYYCPVVGLVCFYPVHLWLSLSLF